MAVTEVILLVIHFSVLLVLSLYGLHRYQLAFLCIKHRNDDPIVASPQKSLPMVTVQLPIFNEKFVIQRLIDRVCSLDYPRELLEIQVLDDSTDETCRLARQAVDEWRNQGIDIVYIHRVDRRGFKAGALEAGVAIAKGEFIAVFDADFLPDQDFLRQTIPHFSSKNIGMVQARWGHINRDESLITRAQAILLDGHFLVEHLARHRSGRFFNFNGTAGIWRRACICDAGGWHHETLTEDLDLSYRAQLKGWEFVYLRDVLAPAELPVDLNAFKTQQHRWAKGSIQVAMKLLPTILRSRITLKQKIEAFVHLTNNFAYVLMLVMSILTPIAIQIRIEHGWHHAFLIDLPVFAGATLSICSFYLLSQKEAGTGWLKRALDIPMTLAIGIGLAVNNTRAVLEACFRYKTGFVRTPKVAKNKTAVGNPTYRGKLEFTTFFELTFAAIYIYSSIYCIQHSVWLALPFMLLFAAGFSCLGLTCLIHGFALSRKARRPITSQNTA